MVRGSFILPAVLVGLAISRSFAHGAPSGDDAFTGQLHAIDGQAAEGFTRIQWTERPKDKGLPRDIQWVESSLEYAALCVQTYQAAWSAVQEAAGAETRNWAVVLDLDETVFNNSEYHMELARQNLAPSRESTRQWILRERARAVPGAMEFIDRVRTLGQRAHVVYITGRAAEYKTPTLNNLHKLGIWRDGDILLLKTDRTDTKVNLRRCVETGTGHCKEQGPLVILAMIGDQIDDIFADEDVIEGRVRRDTIVGDAAWGRKYFILPNPKYGWWEKNYQP